MSGFFRSRKVRIVIIAVIVIFVFVIAVDYYANIESIYTTPRNAPTSVSIDTTSTWNFPVSITVNYSGSWNLVYQIHGGSLGVTGENNSNRNLSGSGYFETAVTMYGVVHHTVELCVTATKFDSQNSLTLTLTAFGTTNSTTPSNPSAEVCATVGG